MLRFKQGMMLIDAISLTEITQKSKLIVDISKFSNWNREVRRYLELDVFRSGTMEVEKRNFCKQKVQIKYFEACWPAALVAHRIQPLPGSMRAHTKKRHRDDAKNPHMCSCFDDVKENQQARYYRLMLHNLMVSIQDYLLLSDDEKQSGALKSLELVKGIARMREDNKICIWLEDV